MEQYSGIIGNAQAEEGPIIPIHALLRLDMAAEMRKMQDINWLAASFEDIRLESYRKLQRGMRASSGAFGYAEDAYAVNDLADEVRKSHIFPLCPEVPHFPYGEFFMIRLSLAERMIADAGYLKEKLTLATLQEPYYLTIQNGSSVRDERLEALLQDQHMLSQELAGSVSAARERRDEPLIAYLNDLLEENNERMTELLPGAYKGMVSNAIGQLDEAIHKMALYQNEIIDYCFGCFPGITPNGVSREFLERIWKRNEAFLKYVPDPEANLVALGYAGVERLIKKREKKVKRKKTPIQDPHG